MSYVIEVADLFLLRCPNVIILDPIDYTIIAEWEKQEVPIAIVFDSLNSVLDGLPQNTELANIKSIAYFQNEVKKNFANWLHNLKDSE